MSKRTDELEEQILEEQLKLAKLKVAASTPPSYSIAYEVFYLHRGIGTSPSRRDPSRCRTCEGTGVQTYGVDRHGYANAQPGTEWATVRCPACGGKGF